MERNLLPTITASFTKFCFSVLKLKWQPRILTIVDNLLITYLILLFQRAAMNLILVTHLRHGTNAGKISSFVNSQTTVNAILTWLTGAAVSIDHITVTGSNPEELLHHLSSVFV